jgi:Tfp pilus assembly protein PilO
VNRTYRILIVVVLCAASVGGYWKFLLAPKRQEAADLQNKVALTQAQLEQTRATLATYKKSAKTYRDNYATVVRLGKAVPADDDTRSLLVQLDTTAKRSAVGFANIDMQQSGAAGSAGSVASDQSTSGSGIVPGAIAGGSFSTMPFSFGFTGTFESLSNFFGRVNRFVTVKGDKIQVNGRLLRIDRIKVTPGEGGWPALQAEIGASTYLLPQTGATEQGPQGATAGGTTTSTSGTTTTPPSTSTGTGTSSSAASEIR